MSAGQNRCKRKEHAVARRPLKYKHKPVVLKKALSQPDFDAATVLADDPWQYVDLWLRRNGQSDARFYWEQAEQFAKAATTLPPTASPLPAYYCLLNATKALLEATGTSYQRSHGVTGEQLDSRRGLRSEVVQLQTNGVLAALSSHLGEGFGTQEYDLYKLLYNLPYIHRAFTVTFKTAKELFIPVYNPRFVVKEGSSETWFEATVEPYAASGHTTAKLPTGYERDHGIKDAFIVRRKKRFKWYFRASDSKNNLRKLCAYHHDVRQQVFYIYGSKRLWYLKRKSAGIDDYVQHTNLVVTFAAMHRLSELARYDPLSLVKHLDAQHNWLLLEFTQRAIPQFIDEIASEMTGRDFMLSGIR